jgi:hypothetical protein
MLVSVKCNVCGNTGKLDIGDIPVEKVKEGMKSKDFGHCYFGNHVELGKQSDYYEILDDTLEEGKAPTDEEWLTDLKNRVGEVWDTDELQQKFTVESFSYGMCCARDKETQTDCYLAFTSSPSGKRYYYK